ncbi:hypothetical protein B0H11DRAFT_1928086 [Mycena galericulata]|nr:hypothetical protein B0H11DRAFT_1928086 [Mycena galericulata]
MRCNSTTSNIDCTQFGTPRPPLSTSVPRTLMVTNPSTSRQVGSGMGAWTCSRHRGLHVLSEHLSSHREFFDMSHNTYFDHPLPAPKHFLATFDVNAMRAGSTGRGRMSGLAGEGRGEQLAAESRRARVIVVRSSSLGVRNSRAAVNHASFTEAQDDSRLAPRTGKEKRELA